MKAFTSLHDLIRAFARAMNLISPEVQSHHEKVAYLSWHLADAMKLDPRQCRMAFYGGLLHDIGGILRQDGLTLQDLQAHAPVLALSASALLNDFAFTKAYSQIVADSQTPWQRLKALPNRLLAPQRIGQIIHVADSVVLLLRDDAPVLPQLDGVCRCLSEGRDRAFNPDVLAALDRLRNREILWFELMYRPTAALDEVSVDRDVSLEETLRYTEFVSRLIDFRSPFTAMHSAGVAATAAGLAQIIGMSEEEVRQMRIAGYLHDVGKLKTPREILEKPGKLTDAEFGVMKEHAYNTWRILKDIKGFVRIADWAALHHEKLDGSGYPFHRKADSLPLGARVMAVADIFSAITEDRPYRRGMTPERAIAVLRQNAQAGQISQGIVELLVGHYDAINESRETASRAASRRYQEALKAHADSD